MAATHASQIKSLQTGYADLASQVGDLRAEFADLKALIVASLQPEAAAKAVQPEADVEPQPKADRKPRLTSAENRALAKRYAKTLTAARKAGGSDGYAAKWAEIKTAEMARLGRI